jgi:hypothetical protein
MRPAICLLVLTAFIHACSATHQSASKNMSKHQFTETNDAQNAVFTISHGWTGGMGEAVFDSTGKTIQYMEGRPVYVNGSSLEKIMEQIKLPDTWEGGMKICVEARIHLEERSERNFSIPGAPEKKYYALVVEELKKASIVK